MINKNHIVFTVFIRFFAVYFLLLFLYNLGFRLGSPDIFTYTTAKQVNLVYRITGFPTHIHVLPDGKQIGIFRGEQWFVNIIEGCNGMSVIIIFLAFIWAFPSGIREKFKFSLIGILSIWLINILRIYILGLIYVYRPEWFDFSHRVLFPASVYIWVIVLWILWIKILLRSSTETVSK